MSIVLKVVRCARQCSWMSHQTSIVVYIEFAWNYTGFNSNYYYLMRITQLWKSPNYANKFQIIPPSVTAEFQYGLSIGPSGIFLPGTELLQSPFRMEFSMGSRSRRYRRSLRSHRRFLRSYRKFLRSCRDPWGDRRPHGRRCGDADCCATR